MDKTDGRKDLADVLDGKHDNTASSPTGMDVSADASSDEEIAGKLADNSLSTSTSKDFCIECEDQPSSIFCQQCADDYCDVCFQAMHRKGKRRSHMAKRIGPQQVKSTTVRKKTSGYGLKAFASARKRLSGVTSSGDDEKSGEDESVEPEFQDAAMLLDSMPSATENEVAATNAHLDSFRERARWIPVRLNLKERKVLRLLEAALTVSEYTDKIDILSYRSNKSQRMVAQIKDLCAILCGLVVASDYQLGQDLFQDKDYKFNEAFFKSVFEVGRRHKIMNPDKMRSTYGKLIYLLMDSVTDNVRDMLEFTCVNQLKTVAELLSARECELLLDDPLIVAATMEIIPENKSRNTIQREIKQKERAIEVLAKKYSSAAISGDDIRNCLYSIGDNNSFLRGNRDPIDKMIALLTEHFSPSSSTSISLAISMGREGARLTHNHERQYFYVLQSLTLWREVNHNMFKLWCLSEQDLLDEECPYRLRDTGQGLNRVQSCPRVSREFHRILGEVMRKVGHGNWVGSSVVHLGDTNVPNSFIFIDKYTQVARILSPIVLCIEKIDSDLAKNPQLLKYIESTFTSVDALKKEILSDFFRHGFDGSGADNFFDAGSCIDGRLTSAWNWCHGIEKKRYFPIFLLTGFIGFDGEF
eukprot:Partr_v1_DN27635_c2_g1_i1_m65344 putative Protein of unknown function (DUF2009)